MGSTWCILQKSIPLFSMAVTFSVMVTHFSGYGIFSVLITGFLLILSPFIIFIYTKQSRGKQIEGEVVVLSQICDEQQDSSPLDQVCKTTALQEVPVGKDEQCLSMEESERNFSHTQKKFETDQTISQDQKRAHQNELRRHDLYSESDSTVDHSFSSEDSDNEWSYSYNFGRSPECSDDSISDEESLIEIAIPSGHYVCPKEAAEPNKFTHLQQKLQNYCTETFLDQHGIIWEQFGKVNDYMNEEDNLIEIDLSMGSIKCSGFEIEA
ncbi:OLC1v1024675C1 [Oldenlandia corymbosa var. corymbosa]|uniref:OLC1v1024675C1 n=1 Tax=Oldenlandia corymbosa var. corymbosa TaxID=529605 RepID=A0AAV1C3B6_OLDCO|nr:OLC1v1024675C1 [Oldenlandia corymbosa var. corymbosa]